MKLTTTFLGVFVSLMQGLQAANVTLAQQVTFKGNKALWLPNNNYMNFSGAGLSFTPWIDEETNLRMDVYHLKELNFTKFSGEGLVNVRDLYTIGENAVLAYNDTEYVVAEINKVSDQLIMFKEIYRRKYESKEVLPFTSVYTYNGPLKSTFIHLSSSIQQDKVQLLLVHMKESEKTFEYPIKLPIAADIEINFDHDLMVEAIIVSKDQTNGSSCILATSFDIENITGQETIHNLGCSEEYNYVVKIEWEAPGKSFSMSINHPSNGTKIIFADINRTIIDKPTLHISSKLYIGASDIEIEECGGHVMVTDVTQNEVFLIVPEFKERIMLDIQDYGIEEIIDATCTNGQIIKVLGKTRDGQSRLLVHRSPLHDPDHSTLHSLIELPQEFSIIGAIDHRYTYNSDNKEVMLIFGLKNRELKTGSLSYYEIYTYGPHLRLDFSAVPETLDVLNFTYNFSDWESGVKRNYTYNSSLRLVSKSLAVNPVVRKRTDLPKGLVPLYNVLNVTSYPYTVQVIENSVISYVEGFPVNKSFLDLKYDFTESVMADRFIFGKTGNGLQVIDKDTKMNLLEESPNCSASKLKTVYNVSPDDGPYFYCLCFEINNDVATQSALFIYRSSKGAFRVHKIELFSTGFEKIVMLSPPNKIDRSVIFTLINTKSKSTVSLGVVTIDNKTETCTDYKMSYDSLAYHVSTLSTSFIFRGSVVMLQCEQYRTFCHVDVFDFNPQNYALIKSGSTKSVMLPGSHEHHEGLKIKCQKVNNTDNIVCLMGGSNMHSYVTTVNFNEILGSQAIFQPNWTAFENIGNLNFEDCLVLDGYGVISLSVKPDRDPLPGAFNWSFWLQIIDLKNPWRTLRIVTTNSSVFVPRALQMADGSLKLYPGAEINGSLTVLELVNSSLSVAGEISSPKSVAGLLKFTNLKGEPSGEIIIGNLFRESGESETSKQAQAFKLLVFLTLVIIFVMVLVAIGLIRPKKPVITSDGDDMYHSMGVKLSEEKKAA